MQSWVSANNQHLKWKRWIWSPRTFEDQGEEDRDRGRVDEVCDDVKYHLVKCALLVSDSQNVCLVQRLKITRVAEGEVEEGLAKDVRCQLVICLLAALMLVCSNRILSLWSLLLCRPNQLPRPGSQLPILMPLMPLATIRIMMMISSQITN